MRHAIGLYSAAAVLLAWGTCVESAWSQQTGTLRGTVTLAANGDALRRATVRIVQLARSTETGDDGEYEFTGVPAGKYDVLAHMHPFSNARQTVQVEAGGIATLDIQLRIAPVHEEVTVTASGKEQLALESFQSVDTLELADLLPKAANSLGELLENESGVAKRSYGPGTSRPVIRGFDGDRVLMLQDGMPTGTLSSQSGDHGEPVDTGNLERVEIVRGPATLLYGTNALGGVVNVITDHHLEHQHPHEGVRGYLTGVVGSGNAQGDGSGGLEAGWGKWLLLASGGGSRTGDYGTPIGTVPNSGTELKNTAASLARFGDRAFFNAGYGVYDGTYGIPEIHAHHHDGEEGEAEEEGPVNLRWRRHNARLGWGVRELGPALERFSFNLNFSDWNHKEIAGGVLGTEFFNRQFTYRGVFDQRAGGRLTGSFGVNDVRRSYKVRGEEQVTPSTTQDAFAVFGLEEIGLGRARVQLGGRLETNRYDPEGQPARSFTGFSGSAGLNARLWRDAAFIASFSHTYRAPAIEELYNHGPHHGNLAFEIGNPNLKRERADGIEFGVRQYSARLHADAGLFYYRISDYVYLAPTGEFEEGLVVANYSQADTRYAGGEANVHLELHPALWLTLGFDSVNAELRSDKTPLPRIPPMRGRVGFDARFKNFSIQPTLVLANAQSKLYENETRTAGYAVLNLLSSYTVTRSRALHIFSLNVFNAGDRLYRNHVSLIKDYAPEIGRGVRFSYTVRFF